MQFPLDRPFTLDDAAQWGLTRRMLQGRRFQMLYPRVYASATLDLTPMVLTQAALLATPSHCVASHHTALMLYGVSVGDDLLPHVATRRAEPVRIRGITVHRLTTMRPVDVGPWRALSPEHALSTSGTTLSLLDLVIATDNLTHRGVVTAGKLDHFLHHHHGAGVRKARQALGMSSARAESPRETVVRLMIELAGLPPLEVNSSYSNDCGFVARLDLSWREWKIAIEYDGRQHGLSLAQRRRDIERREAMEAMGWAFIVITAADLARPRDIVHRVCTLLEARQGWRPIPRFTHEWAHMFEPV